MLGFGAIAEVGLADIPGDHAEIVGINAAQVIPDFAQTSTIGNSISIRATRQVIPAFAQTATITLTPVPPPTPPGPASINADQLIPAFQEVASAFINSNGSTAGGPTWLALAGPTSTTFNATFQTNSFAWESWEITHKEGEKAVLTVTMRNTYASLVTGLIWLWVSWRDDLGTSGTPGTVYPIFYGHIIGVPQDIIGERIVVSFVAEPNDAIQQLQLVAEALKSSTTLGSYDPIWLDVTKRDDPTGISEGFAGSYHFDRLALPNSVSFSSWTDGEDGTLTLLCSNDTTDQGTVPYRSIEDELGRPPLIGVRVEADVQWTQCTQQVVDFGSWSFQSYLGNSIYDQWPQPGAQLGGGWSVWQSVADDIYQVHETVTVTQNYHFDNTQKYHFNGSVLHTRASITWPMLAGPSTVFTVAEVYQPHIGIPFSGGGSVGGSVIGAGAINIPMHLSQSFLYAPVWTVNCSLSLRANVNRTRKEFLNFTLLADVQQVIAQTASTPLANVDTETITIHGADVGQPLAYPVNWSSVAGQAVTRGVIIYPNAPTLPGGTSYQIVLTPGTIGTVQPSYSDTVGTQTTDGTAVLVSMGTSPAFTAPNWTPSTTVAAGTVILPTLPPYLIYVDLVAFGNSQLPPVGTNVSLFQIVQVGGTFFQCSLDGTTNQTNTTPAFNGTPGAVTNDGTVQWTCIGTYLPNGSLYYMAMNSGTTDDSMPDFGQTSGATFTDGGVTWLVLGSCPGFLGIPVGGTAGNVLSPFFFPLTRGGQSVQYLYNLARAKLLYRARNYRVTGRLTWDEAITLSCRMNVEFQDTRFVGGSVSGKVVEYHIRCDGPKQILDGSATILACIGNGGSLSAPAGYTTLPTGDVAYQAPVWTVNDDGLTFNPLLASQVTTKNTTWGGGSPQSYPVNWTTVLDAQLAAMTPAMELMFQLAELLIVTQDQGAVSLAAQIQQARTPITLDRQMKGQETWLQLEILPVAGSTFAETYNPLNTVLAVPKQATI
jgi:hypothetical protein